MSRYKHNINDKECNDYEQENNQHIHIHRINNVRLHPLGRNRCSIGSLPV